MAYSVFDSIFWNLGYFGTNIAIGTIIVVGISQRYILGDKLAHPRRWEIGTIIGGGLGYFIWITYKFNYLSYYRTTEMSLGESLIIMDILIALMAGGLAGAFIGIFQSWCFVKNQLLSKYWIAANMFSWALGFGVEHLLYYMNGTVFHINGNVIFEGYQLNIFYVSRLIVGTIPYLIITSTILFNAKNEELEHK